jgi:Domain of unknown function DUF29
VHNKSWDKVDVEHLVEEIESLGSEQEHAVESHLANLLVHLLKWRYQPRRGKSWQQSVLVARQRIARRLKRNPSLRSRLPLLLTDAYIDARALAVSQTELELNSFPDLCPWTMEQLQDPGFLPEGYACTTCTPVVAPRNMWWKPKKWFRKRQNRFLLIRRWSKGQFLGG